METIASTCDLISSNADPSEFSDSVSSPKMPAEPGPFVQRGRGVGALGGDGLEGKVVGGPDGAPGV
jgi:hypothetical protein